MVPLTIICLALVALNVVQYLSAQKERQKLIRRIAEPQAVVVEERPRHPRPPVIAQNDDAAYKNLREERART